MVMAIEKQHLEKLFLRFQRLNAYSNFEGSGIGLATCKKIMLMHNGDISIDSKPEKGSTFTLTIPKNFNQIF